MEFEASYLLVDLREGGTYCITFRVKILPRKFRNGREIRKTGQKFKKMGAKIQKFTSLWDSDKSFKSFD